MFHEALPMDGILIQKEAKAKTYKIPTIINNENSKPLYADVPISVFSKLYEKYLEDSTKLSAKKREQYHPVFLSYPLKRLLTDFSDIVDTIEYLEAVRANTKRIYTNDSQGTGFNELILEYKSREMPKASKDFTNKWLSRFDIADQIVFEEIEGVATSIYLKKGDKRIALADLGYGITQFLPILLKIAMETPKENKNLGFKVIKKLILLEEPETNLHPKLQSQIADFLYDAINTFEVRVVIETHSEYIIRELQVLTAEKFLKPTDTVIYYFNEEKNKEVGKVVKIDLNENGTMSKEFGSGFFDEATYLKLELLKAKNK